MHNRQRAYFFAVVATPQIQFSVDFPTLTSCQTLNELIYLLSEPTFPTTKQQHTSLAGGIIRIARQSRPRAQLINVAALVRPLLKRQQPPPPPEDTRSTRVPFRSDRLLNNTPPVIHNLPGTQRGSNDAYCVPNQSF